MVAEPELQTALQWAHPVVQEWFTAKFGTPTEPQIAGWPSILAGETTLISAPTGSGKTLAAFLVCIDQLLRKAIAGTLAPCTEVLYVSPLKALSNDVQKNLDAPLREIQHLALERGYLSTEIRTGVRTGDTLTKDRAAMLRNPPHILVTTPESLYILLTAGKSRENLRRVRTIIVDEIHAVADDKRGAHLTLSLERLEALVCGENTLTPGAFLTGLATPPQRIGLSATQNPISLIADFLTGIHPTRKPATIVQVGQRRHLDLAIEIPSDELSSVASTAMWTEIFDKLAALTDHHRSTLVFVNTRRLVEKISFELSQRLSPEDVAAHHGSLSRGLRLDAEQRLKNGQIKILIATGSLELGIDIGNVDLVCQINTTRAVAVAMQRVGRAGHWRGAIPKGRFFATTRDDLLEQAALIRKMHAGELDLLEIPPAPIDVLMQQIVAMCGAEPWPEETLYNIVRRAYPYRDLTRPHFEELLNLLHNGIESSRGRYGAYLLRDGVQGHLHPRRGARMIAIANGGAIPDVSNFAVILQPEGLQIATLDEHFAVDSSPGDVVLLGNSSWRIQKVEAVGRVLVEDAHGAPPSIPFWEGEAPQRTSVVSDGVGTLREEIAARTSKVAPADLLNLGAPRLDSETWDLQNPTPHQQIEETISWLQQETCVCRAGALQLITYIVSGRAALGAVPSKTTIIAERFFDDGGGMQLILHAPFGGRVNKAWGLALRKRFCRGFNFELQAAATDNGINISLAEQHSFPLSDVFKFLTEHTAKELLEQAAIASPIFKNRWRWAAGRSLQLLRMSKGKRIAPQIQRTRSDDLMANVFPQAAACFETIVGDIEIPDHPLVREVMQDVLQEAMDLEGLIEILRGIEQGTIRCLAVDSPIPSVFAHELINAMPYAYLDEAGAEERRARATTLRRGLPATAEDAGRLDQAAIDTVRRQLWPDLRDEHELHDLLLTLTILPLATLDTEPVQDWPIFYERLLRTNRVQTIDCAGKPCWVPTERLQSVATLFTSPTTTSTVLPPQAVILSEAQNLSISPEAPQPLPLTPESATLSLVQGWLQILGPTTANALATRLNLSPAQIFQSFLTMELQGLLLRGTFELPPTQIDHEIEWCERRILQRIHRLTLGTLRKQIEPVSPAVYMRWLLGWQHLAPQTQLSGEEGLLEVLSKLEGFEAPAVEWERTLLPARVANYDPRWLDSLCLSGAVGWGRVSPHPAWSTGDGGAPRRVIPTNAAPITFYIRESAEWLPAALAAQCVDESNLLKALSQDALTIRALLAQRGACFSNDLQRITGLTRQQTQHALWELATAGLASADGFDQLRGMMDPRRKAAAATPTTLARKSAARTTAGRWSLLCEEHGPSENPGAPRPDSGTWVPHTTFEARRAEAQAHSIANARRQSAAHDSAARMLLCRYGVLFRDLLERESNAPKWRDLLPILRRLEARGELRGGRFVTGFSGEQFALAEAVDSLRASRNQASDHEITVAGADPMNLIGIVIPGDRVPAVPGRSTKFRNGVSVQDPTKPSSPEPESTFTQPTPEPSTIGLFQ
ncbi:DEAD/DEAH box helicase [Granulicella tundricola]|uniref:DEAD/H associated domain protein n=1 Tax=Granulicella tundricola (strain ATCC BAA-1859 / DSM 23138 / MP5ACTX9) TaxID=1198114 RepID=E8X115_GRATM|nr:DEAD/DEAH box helicase [Granulicella tundricola]ADW67881.1 DEAD/H associated domain protein [Granulicella tundricola MP5ACTX9]